MQKLGKILFVDDDQDFLAALQRTFRGQFLFDIASSGEDALDLLKTQGPYAVIVADLTMPGMNGLDLLAKVSKLQPRIVQVVLTGKTDLGTFAKAIEEQNIFRYVAKPCDREALRSLLIDSLKHYNNIK